MKDAETESADMHNLQRVIVEVMLEGLFIWKKVDLITLK